jgi:hypothetical protein
MARPCFAGLHEFQRRWLALFRATAARDGARMAEHASHLLATQPSLGTEAREYLLLAGMSGSLAIGNREEALALWRAHQEKISSPGAAAFRLLRCHAEAASCAAEFRRYAER